MIHTLSTEAQCSPSNDSRAGCSDRPPLSKPQFSGEQGNATRTERFRPEAIQRLSIAIINHAVRDLLENGRHSSTAERWLLSQDFDRLDNLLG